MSLHTLAQHLQTAGRGDDKVLVHMTPGEVQGLQSLAMAQGGSLTINPETGLPEAGFLSNLLPTIIGAGLMMIPGMQPAAAAMITGAGYGVATGSLGKGLMAGLGAYGGAGLTGGLASAGAAANAVSNAAMQTPALNVASAQMPVAAGSLAPVAGGGVEAMKFGMYGTNAAGVPQGIFSNIPGSVAATPQTIGINQGLNLAAQQNAAAGTPIVRSTEATVAGTGMRKAPSVLTNVGSGIKELYNDPEKLKKYISENKMNLASSFLPALLSREEVKRPEEPVYVPKEYNWNRPFNPSPLAPGSTAERTYFADGGMTVENMSQQNAMMDNQKYPMAYQNTPTYALPSERPISQNVLYPATDAGVTPYSGIASLAKGGPAVDKYGVERYKDGKSTSPSSGSERSRGSALSQTIQKAAPAKAEPAKAAPPKAAPAKAAPAKGVPISSPLAGPGYGSMYFGPSVAAATAPKVIPAPVVPPPISSTGMVGGVGSLTAMKDRLKTERAEDQADRTATTKTAPVNQASSGGMPKGITALINKLTDPKTDIAGTDRSTINKNFGAEITKQTKELNTFKNNATVKQALSGKFGADIQAQVQGIITDQQADIDAVTAAKTTALDEFTSSTKLTSETISARGYTGAKSDEYKKVGYGSISPVKGWDKTSKYLDAADVKRVYDEVIGRAPTEAEIDKYLGKKMSLQGLADTVNKLPELEEKRTFTDDELQDLAKFYWGEDKKLSDGQLAAFRKFKTFKELRNAFGNNNFYVDNLNKINKTAFTQQQIALQDPGKLRESIKSDFYDTMGRYPTSNEVDFLIEKGLISDDLKTYLKKTNEYEYRGQTGGTQYEGDLNPYTKSKEGEVAEETTDEGEVAEETTDTTGTTGGKKGSVTLGGKSGLVPGVTYTPLSAADLEKFKKEYREYKPSDYSSNVSTYLTSILPQDVSTQSIYTPLGATGALPEYKIEGAMPYYSPEERLGLTNMYKQLAAKAPDIATGLSFTPSQGVVAASPFGNTTPGLITLQSAAAPSTAPLPPEAVASPVIPGTKTGIASLTPAEQALLSQYQTLPQNVEPLASGGIAGRGYHLGDYSDGGRLLKGPGDGVSDSIPASIGNRRPARLADGEFVIPARIVSELGNGSTDAGARQLYAMMDRIQSARRRSVGKGKVAVDSKARKLLPV